MSSNVTTMSHTKHVDIRYKNVNDNVEGGVVKTVFVKSSDNDGNLLTKSMQGTFYQTLKKMICEKPIKVLRVGNI